MIKEQKNFFIIYTSSNRQQMIKYNLLEEKKIEAENKTNII
jgi:hypothetical protein